MYIKICTVANNIEEALRGRDNKTEITGTMKSVRLAQSLFLG